MLWLRIDDANAVERSKSAHRCTKDLRFSPVSPDRRQQQVALRAECSLCSRCLQSKTSDIVPIMSSVVSIFTRSAWTVDTVCDCPYCSPRAAHRNVSNIPQPLHLPLAVEAGEACLAGEELLHGGLFEVALLGDELVQRADQRIHIAQRPRDGALFGERRKRKLKL